MGTKQEMSPAKARSIPCQTISKHECALASSDKIQCGTGLWKYKEQMKS